MSYGANEAVNDAEDQCREDWADLVAQKAAEIVAARDMKRKGAVDAAASWLRKEHEADSDATGVAETECQEPMPSKKASADQVAAIKAELLEDAEAGATSIGQSD